MFWEGFQKYVGVQGVLALLLTLAMVGLLFLNREIPTEVWGLLGVSWGFYFAKNGNKIVTGISSKFQKG